MFEHSSSQKVARSFRLTARIPSCALPGHLYRTGRFPLRHGIANHASADSMAARLPGSQLLLRTTMAALASVRAQAPRAEFGKWLVGP